MTYAQILQWIKSNLGTSIRLAIANARAKNSDLRYTEDWLAGICCRETGELISKRLGQNPDLPSGQQLAALAPLMKGDYTKRPHDPEVTYHGFGFYQADIDSFPAFVKSGSWKDPAAAAAMAIDILEGKRTFLQEHFPDLSGDALDRAITAAYNCGEGSVRAVLNEGHDIDIRTTDKNYSANVWQFREQYKTLA